MNDITALRLAVGALRGEEEHHRNDLKAINDPHDGYILETLLNQYYEDCEQAAATIERMLAKLEGYVGDSKC